MTPIAAPTCMRPAIRPAMRDSISQPFNRQDGSPAAPPSVGALQVDGFSILVDTFPIVFA